MSDERVIDGNGREIKVGVRVTPYIYEGQMICPGGVVTSVTEADGDVDEFGRNIQIGPRVYVTYDDGIEDDWLAAYEWQGHAYVCDDVEVEP